MKKSSSPKVRIFFSAGCRVPGKLLFSPNNGVSRYSFKRRCCRGFSLVEVALVLVIIAVAVVPLMGLIPFGLTNFRQATNNTVQSAIVQSLTNDIFLTDFGNLKAMAGSQGKFYYFDADDAPITNAQGAFYLLLDLLTMPVLGPYAISEPLATAGRGNMNYQIIPFTYITRSTAVQAALRGVQVISIPDTDAGNYKYGSFKDPAPKPSNPYRMSVDVPRTLTQFEARFNRNDVFRSPGEICSIDLVPKLAQTDPSYPLPDSPTRAHMDSYWNSTTKGHRLTGDNSRERPYTNLYPLLTIKSNTFAVHFRVQTLKKVQTSAIGAETWQEYTDGVTGEYRESQTIERYVDANNATDGNGASLPNFADPANYNKTLAPYYKFRVISSRQFAP